MSELPLVKWKEDLAVLLYDDDADEALKEPNRFHLPSDTDIQFNELMEFMEKQIIDGFNRGFKMGKMDGLNSNK